MYRAGKYKKVSVPLENAVWGCYQLTPEVASSIGEPLADTLYEYLPAKWIETLNQGADPVACLGNLYLAITACMENEKAFVARYNDRLVGSRPEGVSRDQKEPGGAVATPGTHGKGNPVEPAGETWADLIEQASGVTLPTEEAVTAGATLGLVAMMPDGPETAGMGE